MAPRLTRRGLLAGAWLRGRAAGPVEFVPVAAPAAGIPGQAGARDASPVPATAARRPPPRLDPARCLPFCQACVERCPVPGALRAGPGGVAVDPARCDGCGLCLDLCPSPGRPLTRGTPR